MTKPPHSEFKLIDEVVSRLGGKTGRGVAVGAGDDSAVFDGGHWPVVTVDTLAEGTHWNPDWSTPADVGFKLLAVNLSDLAAMGAIPGPMLLALSFGDHFNADFLDGLIDGLDEARKRHGLSADDVVPIGGDMTRSSGGHVLSLTLFGRPCVQQRIFLRSDAKPGDLIWVSGSLGASAGGLAALSQGHAGKEEYQRLIERYRRPVARLDLVPHLCKLPQIHAVMDLSDGLVGDITHILERSGVGAEIDLDLIPVEPFLVTSRDDLGIEPLSLALGGGEDFELLVTAGDVAAPSLMELGFVKIGRISSQPQMTYRSEGCIVDVAATGYRHF